MRTYLLAFVVLAACSHPASAPQPQTAADASRATPVVPAPTPQPTAMAMRVPPPTTADAERLAADLRAPDPDPTARATLSRWVRGPLVILDDNGAVRTACDDDAAGAAASWGLAIVDPTKADIACRPDGARIQCEQKAVAPGDRNIDMTFERAGGWALTGIAISQADKAPGAEAVSRFTAALEVAHCPAE